MKKLSVLIALALCLTIGGAYAAGSWIYANGIATPGEKTVGLSLDTATTTTPSGVYEITKVPSFIVKPASASDYTTTLYVANDSEANLVITFTPDDNAPDAVKNNAPDASISFDAATYGPYEGGNIISCSTYANALTWTKDGNGVWSASITAEQFKTCFTLAEYELATIDDHTAYNTAINAVTITVKVSSN